MRRNEKWVGWAFSLPALVLLLLFLLYPALQSFRMSFTNAFMADPAHANFVGLANYKALLHDPRFWHALVNTAYFAAVVVPVQTGLGLLLAVLLNRPLRFRRFFRMVFFSPVVTSMVVVAVLWDLMYSRDGLINGLLANLSIPAQPWLNSPGEAMPAIILMSVWQGVGYQMILFLSGLQDIPPDLYESARIDGASPLQQFLYITVPALRNTFVFVIVVTTVFAFKLFTQVYVMTGGGPFDATRTLILDIYEYAFVYSRAGYASALATVFFAIVLAVQALQRWLIREERA